MINEKELKQYLRNLGKKYPQQVIDKLDVGSKVEKSLKLTYEIDNPNIDKNLGNFPKGADPYEAINKSLKNSKSEIIKAFNGAREIPFSKIYGLGIGQCLEKAILVQLAAQRGRDSFLINGYLGEGGPIDCPHSYNVVFKDEKSFLIDTHNPLKDSNGKMQPYIAPILGIEGDYCDFIVPEEWKQGRNYSI
jgi:hypothetical protein